MRPMHLPINLAAWIEEHADLLRPPVGNAQIWADERLHRDRGRRAEPAHRLPRRPLRGVLLPAPWRHGAAGVGRRRPARRRHPRGRDPAAARPCAPLAAAARAGLRGPRHRAAAAGRAWSTASSGTAPAAPRSCTAARCSWPAWSTTCRRPSPPSTTTRRRGPARAAAGCTPAAARSLTLRSPPPRCPRQESGVTVVDLHSHFFPETWPDLAERFGTPDWPWMRRDEPDHATVMLGTREFRSITSACWDAGVRLADMDRDGVDLQIVSATPVLFAYGRPAEHAMECSRIFNDALLDLCRRGQGRLVPIGQVPLQDPDLACRELERGLAAGMKGVRDRQPRRRPRSRRRRHRDLPDPLRFAGRAGVRAPVGHVRRLPAGGLDAPVDRGHAGRDAALAEPHDPRRRVRQAAPRPADLLRPRRRFVHVPARPPGERLAPPGGGPGPVDRAAEHLPRPLRRGLRGRTTRGRCATSSTSWATTRCSSAPTTPSRSARSTPAR